MPLPHPARRHRQRHLCAGGASLGGSELAKLFIQRRHRYRDMTLPSSFGPGVFCNYDVSLQFQANTSSYQEYSPPYNYITTTTYRVEMFDPMEATTKFLVDGVDGDTQDGIYTDQLNRWVKELRCYDANSNFVTDPNQAATAVLTNWPGYKYTFDLINLDPAATANLAALWAFDEGAGDTASDTSGNGNTGTLVNNPTWTQGKLNGALQFSGGNSVNVGNPADLNFQGQITLAAWINVPSSEASGGVITHGEPLWQPQGPCVAMSINSDGALMQVGASDGSNTSTADYSLSQGDVNTWVHWAGVYDGANWILYRNGQQVSSTPSTLGAVATTANWTIGDYNTSGYLTEFSGGIDDVRIYSRGLSAGEVATLAQQKNLAGRLKSITDRNGYAVTITHQPFTPQQISQSPDLQWQIDTVTDPYGRQAVFSYLPTQVSGRWVVNQITFPNSHKAVYSYSGGQLASVAFDDGTTSTFTYGTDATSQCSTTAFFDVAAEGIHRKKTAYLTNNFVAYHADSTGEAEQVLNQSSMLVRMVTNGDGEISCLFMSGTYNPGNPYQESYYEVYEGAGRMKVVNFINSAAYYQDGWTVGDPANGYSAITGATEPNYVTLSGWNETTYTQTIGDMTDAAGHPLGFSYDGDAFMTATNYPGSSESFSYNQFKQVTRYQDRNSNVTLNTYDAQGNLLSREVGIKVVGGVDTHQPEYAKYQWTYYPAGDANQFLMSSAIDALGNTQNFYYDNNHRLIQVVEAPDVAQGPRATTTISYDAASRIQQISDPETRAVQYAYDQRDRVSTITYGDSSTEQFFYGEPGSGNENLLVKQKDRNGVTTRFDFDATGRVTTTTYAYSTIVGGTETLITDPSVQVVKTCTYLPGTDLVASCTERGETTAYGYDYRQRLVSTTVQPRVGVSLTTTRTYLNNLLFSETDPYGRIKYFGYRSSDGALIREIQGTVPGFTLADFTAVTNQTRDASPNAKFLITDYTLDNNGQSTAIIDGNNVTLAQTFDSRGQLVQAVEASGTPIAGTTGYLFDANGNNIEIRTPRYYDNSDPQVGNVRTQMTYTGRNLLATRTEAPGTNVAATVQYQYNLDHTQATMIDARNNSWQTLWSPCCAGRVTSQLDPTSAGSSIDYDYAGNVTYVQVLQGTTTFNQTTTRYDARHRPVFRTVWLVNPPAVDPNNPPIAGQNGVPTANGLTTQWYYDENLADSVGLSAAAGEAVAGVGNVSIQPLLAEIQSDGITFGTGSDGFAVLEIKPDGELAVTIQDGAHRTVASGIIQPPSGQTPNQPITWSTTLNDAVATVSSPGNLLETAYIDALNNTSRRRADAAGRAIQLVDAESNITTATFDANSNKLTVSDPNSVGYTAVFDARNRETSRTDTMNAQTQQAFDGNSNVVKTVDAKNASSTAVFDARDRRVSLTDRIGGTTSWGFDQNSNVVSLTDSESRTTQFAFDPRNLKITETYADHNPPTVNDQVTFVYDGAKRLQTRTDQQGDYATMIYDMANRLTSRQYRDHTKQPADPPNDTDSFSYDGGNHMLTAVSGRYSNTLTFTYDQAGRLASEALTIGGQTYTVGRSYDAANRLVTITYPDGAMVSQTFTARNLLEQVNYQNALAASFTYDVGGRRATRKLGDTPGTTTTWGYATGGDVITSITTPNLPSFTYSYDANKGKTAESITGALQPYGFSTGAGGYDAEDRLINWARSDAAQNQSWSLTNTGDWQQFVDTGVTHNRTHNAVHEFTTDNSVALRYDTKGNLIADGITGRSFAWDFDNRLQQVAVSGTATTFANDALGRRIAKTTGGITTIYIATKHRGPEGRLWRELAEYGLGSPTTTPQRKYVFAAPLAEPVLADDTTSKYYYHANESGNVNVVTDASGAIGECYAYSAYGQVTILAPDGITTRATTAVGNYFVLAGLRRDEETGLVHCRARFYDPVFGRFLSRDPIGFTGGPNTYRYVDDDPTNRSDPSGLFPYPSDRTFHPKKSSLEELGRADFQRFHKVVNVYVGKLFERRIPIDISWRIDWGCNTDDGSLSVDPLEDFEWDAEGPDEASIDIGIFGLGSKFDVIPNVKTKSKPCPPPYRGIMERVDYTFQIVLINTAGLNIGRKGGSIELGSPKYSKLLAVRKWSVYFFCCVDCDGNSVWSDEIFTPPVGRWGKDSPGDAREPPLRYWYGPPLPLPMK